MRARRRLALLGGTTSARDCLTASSFLLRPWQLSVGDSIRQFEGEFARRIGVGNALSVVHGRVALYGILRALGVGAGDEVLVPVPTHVVVPNAVRYTGARAVYVDCSLETYTIDVAAAERRVTGNTKAMLVQHTFGIPADLDALGELARRHDLHVIEDCVHSLGASYRGRPVGSWGRAGFFSTEETKTISTTMGGMAITDDPALAAELREFGSTCRVPPRGQTMSYLAKLVAYHLLTEPHVHVYAWPLYERLGRRQLLGEATAPEERRGERPPGYNQRLSNAQAAVGLRQLRRLDANLAHRCQIAAIYERELRESSVVLPRPPEHADPVYLRFPVRVRDRDAVRRAVLPLAVPGRWFTSVLQDSSSPAAVGYEPGSCPNAETVAQDLVNLPTHPRVTPVEAQKIATAVAECDAAAGDGGGRERSSAPASGAAPTPCA